jgi:hypothetical protein
VLVIALACVPVFASGFFFDRWLRRPFTRTLDHRALYLMERV